MAGSSHGPGHDPEGPLDSPPPFPRQLPLGAKLVAEVCRGSSPTSGELVEGYYLSRSRPRRFWFLWERAVDWDRWLDDEAGRVPLINRVVAWLPESAIGPEDAAAAMLKEVLAVQAREFGKEYHEESSCSRAGLLGAELVDSILRAEVVGAGTVSQIGCDDSNSG